MPFASGLRRRGRCRYERFDLVSEPRSGTTFAVVTFDLSATFVDGGTHAVLRQLLLDSFGVENLPSTTTTVELFDALRVEEILSQVSQPQDRLLPDSEIERINGEVVIAEENQVLWSATLDRHVDQPTVAFFEEPPEQRTPGLVLRRLGSLDLDRFLLGVLVANAVYSEWSSRFRVEIEPQTAMDSILASAVQPIAGTVQFPAVIAAPGWFGMRWNASLDIVAVDPGLAVKAILPHAPWERFTEIPPSQTPETPHRQLNPWQLDPTASHWRWMPVAE